MSFDCAAGFSFGDGGTAGGDGDALAAWFVPSTAAGGSSADSPARGSAPVGAGRFAPNDALDAGGGP